MTDSPDNLGKVLSLFSAIIPSSFFATELQIIIPFKQTLLRAAETAKIIRVDRFKNLFEKFCGMKYSLRDERDAWK